MNKKIKITIIIFIIIIVAYILFKGLFLIRHYVEPIENLEYVMNGLSLDETLTVYDNKIEEEEYLKENNIKIRNDFKNFIKKEKENEFDSTKYLLYDENNKLKAAFWMGEMDQYIEVFTMDSLVIFGENSKGIFNDSDRKRFLKDNKIENDVDFFKYIKNNYYAKSNIFTSFKEIKENYIINMFVSVALPSISSTTIIDGDYYGYIFNINDNMREVHILKDKKSYVFMFMGKEYTKDEYIKEILGTIEFE